MSHDFPGENFLLENNTSVRLYREYAAILPIIDFHNHLSPQLIAEDHRFENMTRIWLAGDHYKWRAMRACGVDEKFITGNASDHDKFQQWASVTPRLLRNPLYHWTHMELANPFGMTGIQLNADTAGAVWNKGNQRLIEPDFSTQNLLRRANVKLLCTTDDPVDDLRYHKQIADDKTFDIQVLPTFRPDALFAIESPSAVNAWLDQLSQVSGVDVTDWDALWTALSNRCDYFHAAGCRLSDHGLEQPHGDEYTDDGVRLSFQILRSGRQLEPAQAAPLKSAMLHELGLLYHQRGWTQQFHLGALRNVNTRAMDRLGRDAGCDTIGDFDIARPLARMIDRWDRDNRLAKTILYNLNPRDTELMAAMCGSFQDGTVPGKVQYGSAWWFLDQKNGIENQLNALSNIGVLGTFVGMVTDSRSFLSFSRHDYFRRVLCNLLGSEMERGLLPNDFELVGSLVRDICYNNAAKYFGFNVAQMDAATSSL